MESAHLLTRSGRNSKLSAKFCLLGIIGVCSLASLSFVSWRNQPANLPSLHSSFLRTYKGQDDPEKANAAFTFLALGDWGGTLGKEDGDPGSCCKMYNGSYNPQQERFQVDYYAQIYVAELMAQSAAQLKPVRILGHGDNFYWNGVGTEDAKYRLEQSFERIYDAPSLQNIPWINVAGNHDLGGNSFLCGEKDNEFRECETMEELIAYIDIRFEAQANYTSPQNNRWILKDHYYIERVVKNGVSVEIFNLDTNHAEIHGAKDVCCQCFDYAPKFGYDKAICDTIVPGHKACFGGNLTMFQECVDKINGWADESYERALVDIQASSADFKIVNTHYSPHYHMSADKMTRWYHLCRQAGVHAWFNGHTHGFNHDIASWGTHFFENGGGGGYWTRNFPGMNNGFVKKYVMSIASGFDCMAEPSQWRVVGNPYGFMELSFSKQWLKVQFVTFDAQWEFGGEDRNATRVGGLQRGHCWFIPRESSKSHGIECKSSVNGAIGAPLQDD